ALRAARRVEPERSLAGAALAAQHGATMRLLLLQIPGQLIFGIASQAALLLLAGSTVMLTMRGELSIPAAIALIVVIVRYLEPFTVLAELSPGIETCIGALRRIREVLEAPVDSADSPARTASVATSGETSSETPDEILDETSDERGTATSSTAGGAARIEASAAPRIEPRIAPRIELRGIRFGYGSQRTDRQVFDGFDLVLEPGTTTAIVGPSGSGKSTLLTLIAGLHAPEAGSIAVDGIDVSTLDLDARRDLVSVVFQHPYLFDGDIRQNVLVGDPAAGSDDLDRVARLARVDTLLARLSDVWESRVGEAGSSLSGGERQRVSIARALLKPAPVLLVDEPTNDL
ncbi:ATP-binding cassette domain-containing protein, partial [Leucobacter soli]|uniref:ATP-binding cassette domain-containing protein n=1 Tax=Leucobacter soli TaxID=2812850 RepID=UPI00361646BA